MINTRYPALAIALTLLCSLPALAADDHARGAAAYERALERLKNDETQAGLIELKNAVQAAPNYLPAWLELGKVYLALGYGQLAEGAYERASKLGADVSLTLLPRARSYLIQGKLDELLALDAAGTLGAADEAALLVLQGNAQLEAGELNEALAHFRRAEELDSMAAAPLWGTALAKLRAGDVAGAQYQADRAKALAPELAETWYVRADIARQAGQNADALSDFSRAIELEPGHMPARLGRAALLMDENKLDEAARDLAAVREAQPDDLQAMHLQALLFAMQGRQAEADEVLGKARARLKELPEGVINGNLPSLMLSALLALKDGQPETAIEYLQRYLARARDHVGATKLLAAAYLQNDQPGEARALLEPLMVAQPKDAAILNLLGTAYARAGDDTLAAAMLERAIELGADTPAVRQQLGQLQLAAGDTAAAGESFARAAEQDPGGDAAFMLALTALREGDLERAQRTVDQLLTERPKEPAYHNLNGSLALMRNDRAAARTAWTRTLDLQAGYPPAVANLAALARTEGNPDEARRLYEQILGRDPTSADALRGLAELAVDAGDHKEAIRRLRDLRQHHPRDLDAGLLLVRTQIAARDSKAARADLDALRRHFPNDVRPRLLAIDLDVAENKGGDVAAALREAFAVARPDIAAMRLVMQRQVQYAALDDALATANAVVQLRPSDLRAQQEMGELEIRLGHYASAASRVGALESRFADSPVGPGLRAKLALAQGQPQAAVDALNVARARAPNMPELAVALAQARLAAGDRDTGLAELTTLAGTHAAVRPILADALLAAARWPEAAATLEQVLAQDANNTAALNNLAWAYQQAGDARAKDTARRLLDAAPKDAASLDTAGWVLVQAGEAREGVGILRNALTRAPKEGSIRYHLAAGLAQLGEKAEALKLLEGLGGAGTFPEQAAAEALRDELRGTL